MKSHGTYLHLGIFICRYVHKFKKIAIFKFISFTMDKSLHKQKTTQRSPYGEAHTEKLTPLTRKKPQEYLENLIHPFKKAFC